jgi:hypothetical protein
MRAKDLPSVEVLQEWFCEEPAGVLRWRRDYLSSRHKDHLVGKAGEVAGRTNQGRVWISLEGRTYLRARLIYKMHKGKSPNGVVGHINQNTLDDRFENLKNVPNSLAVRTTRDRDECFFVVTARTGADGATVKTVTLSWQRCWPDENAEAIAAELNARNDDYLRGLNRERLVRQGKHELMSLTEAQRQTAAEVIHKLDQSEEREQVA